MYVIVSNNALYRMHVNLRNGSCIPNVFCSISYFFGHRKTTFSTKRFRKICPFDIKNSKHFL